MQVAYAAVMENSESPRRLRRRLRLEELVRENGGAAQVARETGTPRSHLSALANGSRGLGDELAAKLELAYAKPPGWFDVPIEEMSVKSRSLQSHAQVSNPIQEGDSLTIQQFNTGGAMGYGLVLQDQPGVIKSWTVSPEWVRQNVHRITGPKNLAIVTGFGDSMRPLYNPGDPLLIDTGIKRADIDGIYFFRVEDQGYVKRLQRIPTQAGLVIRAKSENISYEPFDIMKGMDFEVFGRVVKAWQGTDF